MKQKHEQMLMEALTALNTMNIHNDNIMIVGSIALDICGLFPEYRNVAHDVDLVIKAEEHERKRIIELIRMLNKINQVDGKDLHVSSESSCYVLKLKNVVLNIWFYLPSDTFNTDIKLGNGVWVERPIDCINKKKIYNRQKDSRDITAIVKQIL